MNCLSCARGSEPFARCVTVLELLSDSCINCHYDSEGARCSFQRKFSPSFLLTGSSSLTFFRPCWWLRSSPFRFRRCCTACIADQRTGHPRCSREAPACSPFRHPHQPCSSAACSRDPPTRRTFHQLKPTVNEEAALTYTRGHQSILTVSRYTAFAAFNAAAVAALAASSIAALSRCSPPLACSLLLLRSLTAASSPLIAAPLTADSRLHC